MIYLGVGSNEGDRWAALVQGYRELVAAGVRVARASPVYETAPWGVADQPPLPQCRLGGGDDVSPAELLSVCQAIERRLGRPQQNRMRWGPRVLDLDLLAYGEVVCETPELTLPHPWIPHRPFVLGPWKDLAPYFYLVPWEKTVWQLWQRWAGSSWGSSCRPTRPATQPASADSVASDTVRAARALQKSLSLFEVGDTTTAVESLRVALHLVPQSPYLSELMGFYHYTQGQDDSALFYYRQALARGGSSAELHHRMASAFLLKKDFTQAQYHLQKALSLDSLNPAYWVTYGLWAHQQGQHPLAETYWKKALAIDSTTDKARALLFDLYLATLQ
jgi:2-amino-4-hydroxy-6-hydroxymethyldihydropteridine diphosphokinase